MRKRILAALASGLAVAVLLPAATFAASARTEVSGVVTNNGSPVKGAEVVVICDSNAKDTKTDKTGTYLVQYAAVKCPNGATAHVTATAGSLGGNNSGSVNGLTEKLNVAIVNVSVVPEFGLITGLAATILGGAGYLVIRRHETSGREV